MEVLYQEVMGEGNGHDMQQRSLSRHWSRTVNDLVHGRHLNPSASNKQVEQTFKFSVFICWADGSTQTLTSHRNI